MKTFDEEIFEEEFSEEEIIEEEIEEEEIIEEGSEKIRSNKAFFNLPALPGNAGGEGDASFGWLEGSQFWSQRYDLPEDPSLRLDEDDFFFQLLRSNAKSTSDAKPTNHDSQKLRFFQAVPKRPNIGALEEAENALEHSLANQAVPTHIRKLEIELVQRQLPRYPSQTHRKKASFYPIVQEDEETAELTSCSKSTQEAKFLAFYRSRLHARKKRLAELEEKKRLRKERKAKRCAEKEARRNLARERKQSKKRSRSQAASVTATTQSEPSKTLTSPRRTYKARVPPPSPRQVTAMAGIAAKKTTKDNSTDELKIETSESFAPSAQESSMLSSVGSMSSDDMTLDDIEVDDEEYLSTKLDNFYSDEKQMMQQVHYRNIEDAEREQLERRMEAERNARTLEESFREQEEEPLEIDEHDEEEVVSSDLTDNLPPSDEGHASSASLQSISPPELPEEHYEPQVGIVPPSLQAMILQAQSELRNRKVPEEHKKLFKPTCGEAAEIGRFTRLNEHVVEAYGTKQNEEKALLPSVTWKQGQEQVHLPKTADATASNTFMIFSEAAALGKLKALKPKVVTNYDPLGKSSHREELDIDDENKVKAMRTNFLTEEYVQGHLANKKDELWDGVDFEEEVHYESLDDVQLPAESCPVIAPVSTTMTSREMMDAIGQAVAERAWDRRYRLERPRAKQKITRTCSCKFCHNPNPFQTHAYRKKWLIQQGLWKEPSEEEAQPIDIEHIEKAPTIVDEVVVAVESAAFESDKSSQESDYFNNTVSPTNDQVNESQDVVKDQPESEDEEFVEEVPGAESDSTTEIACPVQDHDHDYIEIVTQQEESMEAESPAPSGSLERPSSAENLPPSKKPRKKRSFLREIISMLGLVRPDDDDNSASARAQRRRRERRQNRQRTRHFNTSIPTKTVGEKLSTEASSADALSKLPTEMPELSINAISVKAIPDNDPIDHKEEVGSTKANSLQHELDETDEGQIVEPQFNQPTTIDAQTDATGEIEPASHTNKHVTDPVLNTESEIGQAIHTSVPAINRDLNFDHRDVDSSCKTEIGVEDEHSFVHEEIDYEKEMLVSDEENVASPPEVFRTGGGYLDDMMKYKSRDGEDDNKKSPTEPEITNTGFSYLDEILKRKAQVDDGEHPLATSDTDSGYHDEIRKRKKQEDDEKSLDNQPSTSTNTSGGGYLDEILKRKARQDYEKPLDKPPVTNTTVGGCPTGLLVGNAKQDDNKPVKKAPTTSANLSGEFLDEIAKLKLSEDDNDPEDEIPAASTGSSGGCLEEILKRNATQDVEELPGDEPQAVTKGGGSYLDELLKRRAKADMEEHEEEPADEPPAVTTGGGGYLDELLKPRAKAYTEVRSEEPADEPSATTTTTGGGGYLDAILKIRRSANVA